MTATALIRPGEIDQWDQALYAFLAENERRSGSMRTVQSYSHMLQLHRYLGAGVGTLGLPSHRELDASCRGQDGQRPWSRKVLCGGTRGFEAYVLLQRR